MLQHFERTSFCHFIILGERSATSENFRISFPSQTSVISVPYYALVDRAIRIQNGRYKTQKIDRFIFYCGRQEEPAILISAFPLQRHARQLLVPDSIFAQFVSLPLRMYGMYEKTEIEVQPGTFPVHVAFALICVLIPPRASCDLFFLDLKRGTRVLFVLHLKSVMSEIVVRSIRSSLISMKRGARASVLLGARFYTDKIILLYYSRDVFEAAFTYVKRSFNFSLCVFAKFHTMQLSAGTVLPLNQFVRHEINQLHCNKPRSKHRAITVRSRQIQCEHS